MNGTMLLTETVLHTIRREEMFPPNCVVVVGLSGGADSVTLLHVLTTLKEELSISEIVAVHIDHQLRGEESLRDRVFSENVCQQLSIPFHAYIYDVRQMAKDANCGIEEMGRQLRYQAFSEVANHYPCVRIATAHNADDNAETMLLHLCRGCGLHGLTGIPSKRGIIVRPLLDCTRGDIEDYCRQNRLSFVNDSTNTDVSYSRNRVRHEILPSMKLLNPAVTRSLLRVISQCREIDRYLGEQAAICLKLMYTDNINVYLKTPLLQIDSVICREVLHRVCQKQSIAVEEHHISYIEQHLETGGAITLPGGYRLVIDKETVFFQQRSCNEPKLEMNEQAINLNELVYFSGKCYRLEIVSRDEFEEKVNIHKLLLKSACSYDMIKSNLVLRSRKNGDSFHPSDRKCGKTLKKLFNEQAVAANERPFIPVLCDEEGIVLVAGFGCDERVKITKQTQWVLMLKKAEE